MSDTERNGKFQLQQESTGRAISQGAEYWLGRKIPVLDHGFVYLVDYMGNDQSIEQAARVSYQEGTRATSQTRGLVRYLKRHWHTTPFEMVELKFHAKMPIFVARQWVRHRTASINEESGRYSILSSEFYIPEPGVMAEQSKINNQGRGRVLDVDDAEDVRELLIHDAVQLYDHYKYLLNTDESGNPVDEERPGLARELARMDLSLNYYTQWYWKSNLHNLFHFLKLRMDSHAQHEIRVYADAMAKIVKDSFPIAWEAFENYDQNAVSLSEQEQVAMGVLFHNKGELNRNNIKEAAVQAGIASKREQDEFAGKLKNMGIIKE